jgi:hypothetical protein
MEKFALMLTLVTVITIAGVYLITRWLLGMPKDE